MPRVDAQHGELPHPEVRARDAHPLAEVRAVALSRNHGDALNQFAVEVASNARMTVTLIWPGNVISSAI